VTNGIASEALCAPLGIEGLPESSRTDRPDTSLPIFGDFGFGKDRFHAGRPDTLRLEAFHALGKYPASCGGEIDS